MPQAVGCRLFLERVEIIVWPDLETEPCALRLGALAQDD
jgi:hypothetical protein